MTSRYDVCDIHMLIFLSALNSQDGNPLQFMLHAMYTVVGQQETPGSSWVAGSLRALRKLIACRVQQ